MHKRDQITVRPNKYRIKNRALLAPAHVLHATTREQGPRRKQQIKLVSFGVRFPQITRCQFKTLTCTKPIALYRLKLKSRGQVLLNQQTVKQTNEQSGGQTKERLHLRK